MKKKTIANLVMAAVIIVIAAAGILGVGCIQGWFDPPGETQAVLESTRGVVDLMRSGLSYPVENTTVLRAGDQLTCQNGATAVIRIGSDQITLGEKASITVTDPSADSFCAEIHTGEVFAHCDTQAIFSFDGRTITVRQATALLSIRSGAQSVSVLRGSVGDAGAGELLQFIGEEKAVSTLPLESLNDFTTAQIRSLQDASLCFTADDLDRLAASRQQALQELINTPTQPVTPTEPAETTVPAEPLATDAPPTASAATEPPEVTEPPQTVPETTAPAETAPVPASASCTLAIYCDTILNNMESLEPGKAEFVPGSGVILYPVTVEFSEGETVFDVLKRVCDRTGIQLEYSWTPLYNSYYVEGIHNLYEFDCGFESGWMYKVNGWFPNYGCSSYNLKDGDVIVWCYTCTGLGTDVGAPRME